MWRYSHYSKRKPDGTERNVRLYTSQQGFGPAFRVFAKEQLRAAASARQGTLSLSGRLQRTSAGVGKHIFSMLSSPAPTGRCFGSEERPGAKYHAQGSISAGGVSWEGGPP